MELEERLMYYRLLDAAHAQNELAVRTSHELKRMELARFRMDKVRLGCWVGIVLLNVIAVVTFLTSVTSIGWIRATFLAVAMGIALSVKTYFEYQDQKEQRAVIESTMANESEPIDHLAWFNQMLVSGYRTRELVARKIAEEALATNQIEHAKNYEVIADDWKERRAERIGYVDSLVSAKILTAEERRAIHDFALTGAEN